MSWLRDRWPFRKRKHGDTGGHALADEIHFLTELAGVECLAEESPAVDGAALIIRDERLEFETVIEARLPGWREPLSRRGAQKRGQLLVYLQNVSDRSIELRVPEFIMTGGLKLPWHVGVVLMLNVKRCETGEALCWQITMDGSESRNLLALEISKIIQKCRTIAAG